MNTLAENVVGSTATGLLILGSAMIDVSDPVIVGAGGLLFAALTGTVKVLWDRNTALSKATDVALSKCEEQHKTATTKYEKDQQLSAERMNVLIQQVITLSEAVGTMKGRIQGFQEATDKAEHIARERAGIEHPLPQQHDHVHHTKL